MFETIEIETDARGVATLWLNRADKRNAMSAQMIADLHKAAEVLGADDAVRVVVLAARGAVFCAGGDLKWMQTQMGVDAATRRGEAGKLAYMLRALDLMPKPLIGRVQGNAFGGGLGLMSVCDVAVGVQGASFGFTETRLGLVPATIGPYVIARMGAAHARRVFMSARIFDADEAMALGLLAQVVAPDQMDDAVEAQIIPYLACAPGAVAEAKALIDTLGSDIDEAAIEASIDALVTCWESAESAEGIAAFFEKRKADWVR